MVPFCYLCRHFRFKNVNCLKTYLTKWPVGRKIMGMISVIDNEVIRIIMNICKCLTTKVTLTLLMMQTFYRNGGLGNRKELGLDVIISFIFRVSNSGGCKFNFVLSSQFPSSAFLPGPLTVKSLIELISVSKWLSRSNVSYSATLKREIMHFYR